MTADKKVGVSDIARYAGVSIGTVSNYLNYPDRVSSSLKTKISSAIKELGYVPRRTSGHIPSSPTTPVIGFIMSDIELSLFTSIFEGVQEVCEEHDMQVIGLNSFSDCQRQTDMVNLLIQMNVAGIILCTVENSPEDVAAARAAGIPIILVDHTNPRDTQPVCSVMTDNVLAGQIAAEELLRTGCTRLFFFAHSFDYESVQNRQLGIQKAVMLSQASGKKSSLVTIDTGGLDPSDGYDSAVSMLDIPSNERPDGIITVTTSVGIGVLNALTKHNIDVPDEISVISCEEAMIEPVGYMPLTCVEAPAADIGRKAMTQMLDYMGNSDAHVHGTTLLQPSLVKRASTR